LPDKVALITGTAGGQGLAAAGMIESPATAGQLEDPAARATGRWPPVASRPILPARPAR
jgi:hypothetical protein